MAQYQVPLEAHMKCFRAFQWCKDAVINSVYCTFSYQLWHQSKTFPYRVSQLSFNKSNVPLESSSSSLQRQIRPPYSSKSSQVQLRYIFNIHPHTKLPRGSPGRNLICMKSSDNGSGLNQ